MVGRIIKTSDDDSRLGRWCYVQIAGRYQKKVTIVNVYRPCNQANPGDGTVNAKQWRITRQQGQSHPKPQTQWIHDIT
eukprot:7062571-Ditylum_brightwellii.AAC.2